MASPTSPTTSTDGWHTPPSPSMKQEQEEEDDFVRLGNPSHPFRQKHNAHVAHTFVPLPPGTVPIPVGNNEWQLINVSKRSSSLAAAQRHTSLSSAKSMPTLSGSPPLSSPIIPYEPRPPPPRTPTVLSRASFAVSEKRRSSASVSASAPHSPTIDKDARTVPSLTMSHSTLSCPTVQSLTEDQDHHDTLHETPAFNESNMTFGACELVETRTTNAEPAQWDDDIPHDPIGLLMDEEILENSVGDKVTLRDLVAKGEKKTVLFFIRHLWCGVCQDYMLASMALLDREKIEAAGVHVAVISCGGRWSGLEQYRKATHCEFDMYTDFKKTMYQAFGFKYGWMRDNIEVSRSQPYHQHSIPGQIAHGTTRAVFQVWKGAPKNSSVKQHGGEVIFSPNGEILKLHRMKNACDHFEAIDVIREAGVEDLEPRELDFNPKSFFNKRKPKIVEEEEDEGRGGRKDSIASFGSAKSRAASIASSKKKGAESPGLLGRMFSTSSGKSNTNNGWNAKIVSLEQQAKA